MVKTHGYNWDFFIAHSSEDIKCAEDLFSCLMPYADVFLDSKTLLAGDEYDLIIPNAQRTSLITVVLVSDSTEEAYYQREEISAAIDMARKNSESHRVIPICLNSIVKERMPYGLKLKHSITLSKKVTIDTVADQLLTTLVRLNNTMEHTKGKNYPGKLQAFVTTRIELLCGTMRMLRVSRPVPVADIFVELNLLEGVSADRILEDSRTDYRPNSVAFDRLGLGKIQQHRLDAQKVVTENPRLMIFGKPGSGKTTLLKS